MPFKILFWATVIAGIIYLRYEFWAKDQRTPMTQKEIVVWNCVKDLVPQILMARHVIANSSELSFAQEKPTFSAVDWLNNVHGGDYFDIKSYVNVNGQRHDFKCRVQYHDPTDPEQPPYATGCQI